MPKLKMSVCGALLATSILGMPAVSAHAAEAVADQDDVLIVTARKREETLIEVPMSITAFSEKFLEDLRVNSLEDALQYAANVDFDDFQNDSFTGSIAIRGVVRLTDVEEPGYGLYKDGVYIGSSVVGLDEFTDLERLEILKGPQGGLYGRNAIGGAIFAGGAAAPVDYGAMLGLPLPPGFGLTNSFFFEVAIALTVTGSATLILDNLGHPRDEEKEAFDELASIKEQA